jgi:hypothetical protein
MGVMPYQFEKGLFPTLLEAYFNEGLDDLESTATFHDALGQPGPTARLRAIWRFGSVARFLRETAPAATLAITPENSFIRSRLFDHVPDPPAGDDFQKIVAERWLGMKVTGKGEQRTFERRDPTTWQPGDTIGHWNGYYGNVELIVAEAVQRMLEVSLGIDHVDPPGIDITPNQALDLEQQLANEVTRVWPVYLFLTCPKPWFEAWITWQRHSKKHPELRGQVTVILATPGHARPVSPSPVDLLDDKRDRGGRPNAYYLHGREPAAHGYEGVYLDPSDPVTHTALAVPVRHDHGRPKTSSGDQGMWVVTHENHDSTIVWSSFMDDVAKEHNFSPGEVKSEAWDLPPIASYRPALLEERDDVRTGPKASGLTGYANVVVVQPADLDGGAVQP